MVVGAICARGGSKGVPRKNLRLLDGQPLLVHAIHCARSCPSLDRVVVSTDDGPSLAIDLSRVHQDEYQRLVTGDRVIVTGSVGRNGVLATSIESVEP